MIDHMEILAKEYLDKARTFNQKGLFDEALPWLEKSIQQKPSGDTYRNMAVSWAGKGNRQKALYYIEQALSCNHDDDMALGLMAEIFLQDNNTQEAIDCYARAILTNPERRQHKQRFIDIVEKQAARRTNENIKKSLMACFLSKDVSSENISLFWYTTLLLNNAFAELVSSPTAAVNEKTQALVLDELFIEGLKHVRIPDFVFEKFIILVRSSLLEKFQNNILDNNLLNLVSSVALYAFNVEYIFDISETETEFISLLKDKIEKESSEITDAHIAIYACYEPLYTLDTARNIEQNFKDTPFLKKLIQAQLRDTFELNCYKDKITSLTPISSDISLKVQQQYEKFPYPKYSRVVGSRGFTGPEIIFKDKPFEALVVGCGTGLYTIELALSFPQASITAIDLSKTSLSYAMRAAEQNGVSNVSFFQADILELPEYLTQRFDYISTTGVLHHLETPIAGWQSLSKLLKPDGIIHAALYSRLARQNLLEVQKIIHEKGYSRGELNDIRRFRRDIFKILSPLQIESTLSRIDYFHTSMCRDLLFHVNEHCYDIPMIEQTVNELGMQFLKMCIMPDIDNSMARYMKSFPQDKSFSDLKNWHKFELKNPDTFIHMYTFWLKNTPPEHSKKKKLFHFLRKA